MGSILADLGTSLGEQGSGSCSRAPNDALLNLLSCPGVVEARSTLEVSKTHTTAVPGSTKDHQPADADFPVPIAHSLHFPDSAPAPLSTTKSAPSSPIQTPLDGLPAEGFPIPNQVARQHFRDARRLADCFEPDGSHSTNRDIWRFRGQVLGRPSPLPFGTETGCTVNVPSVSVPRRPATFAAGDGYADETCIDGVANMPPADGSVSFQTQSDGADFDSSEIHRRIQIMRDDAKRAGVASYELGPALQESSRNVVTQDERRRRAKRKSAYITRYAAKTYEQILEKEIASTELDCAILKDLSDRENQTSKRLQAQIRNLESNCVHNF